MKRTTSNWMLGMALIAALGVSVADARAQQAVYTAPGAPQPDLTTALRIRKLPRLTNERDWKQRTPVFTGQAARTPREWGVFEVVFDSQQLRWIDELTVTFHLMVQGVDDRGEQQFSLYRLTSRFIDVEQGRNKTVSAVLLPSALLRHGRPVGFAAEFSIGGQVVASETDVAATFLTARWWENPAIVDSPRTVKREGYLLERSKTPFALVNIDDNEVSK